MIFRQPLWMTQENGGASSFFVVQERQLPARFNFWRGNVRDRIYARGDFPWPDVVTDLPGVHFGADGGDLPRRAVSCRLIDEQTVSVTAEPVVQDEIQDRLIDDPRKGNGAKAIRVDVIGAPQWIGQPKILLAHHDHVIVRIAWCSSVPMKMKRETLSPDDLRRYGSPGAWHYTPLFDRPVDVARYLLAFWEVPLS